MKNIFLTSCGIINNEIKNEFYNAITKDVKDLKVLYITTASDGEADLDKTWMEEEFQTILDLGILKENITEHKIGNEININEFDVMYMMGGNTFYLLNIIRKTGFDKNIKEFINSGKIYVGSSAGSEILGNSIDVAIGYDDNNVNMTDFTGLKIVDGLIIPHCNRKEDFINKLKNETNEKLYLLYDGDGIII
ncbi:MAG: Type 1 glutamine amidotransferase-like domain-containing protein [Bacilli bacterium]|nr:Type 1 glutamine amidotransferase-like domain-containing protein [Bacilli bacterium]